MQPNRKPTQERPESLLTRLYDSADQIEIFRPAIRTSCSATAGETKASTLSVRLCWDAGSAGALASVLRWETRYIGPLFRDGQYTLLVRGSGRECCGTRATGNLAGSSEGIVATTETS